jgi:hypothetical protein
LEKGKEGKGVEDVLEDVGLGGVGNDVWWGVFRDSFVFAG